MKKKFGGLARRMSTQFVAFSCGNYFPFLRWVDVVTGLMGSLKESFNEFDSFLERVIEEHKKAAESNDQDHEQADKDFVDILLRLQKDGMLDVELTQENIKAILVSRIEVIDIDQMDYFKCVIKETLRLHPPAVLIPRATSKNSVKLGGYDIPPNTNVHINAWAIQRDPKLWDRPEEFIPERFENNPVDFRGQEFHLIPFGGGRRGCPGSTFGLFAIEYMLSNLLYWFDWKLPENGANVEDMDMTEAFAIAVHKKIPLTVDHAICVTELGEDVEEMVEEIRDCFENGGDEVGLGEMFTMSNHIGSKRALG
ncbi:hypothetical protein FEM48_Zijuj05G0066700 [Ziziphus jujuba var. spinosa]|uniref:Cytochrome P450 71A1-like n=1 Tax=Ziziphus jujuba var. spinosa TaxID=714518 RepID=A0A978VDE5_ZIZJJ|nr:hypothetical protein FEM48_Zijuj05G0066700 [Ziziphus jujuba var. spinosa]